RFLTGFLPGMREDDVLMITADHGCDPSYLKTTDHTREYVPWLVCGKHISPGSLGTRLSFATIAQTVCAYLGVDASSLDGQSVWDELKACPQHLPNKPHAHLEPSRQHRNIWAATSDKKAQGVPGGNAYAQNKDHLHPRPRHRQRRRAAGAGRKRDERRPLQLFPRLP